MSATNLCLSLTPNLRCQSLTQSQTLIILIPPALEIIYCTGLCYIKRKSSRRYYLLAGEGLLYFILALGDVIAHIVTVISDSVEAFKVFDIVLGVMSGIPLLMFALFLSLYISTEFLPVFPARIQRVTKYTLILCVPLIVVLNALASFLNLRYGENRSNPDHPTPGIKYLDPAVEIFLNSFTLIIFIAFQVLSLGAALLKLLKAFINQSRIDRTAGGSDREAHLFNGLGWITLGILIGVVESIIGFVDGSFCMIFVRRMLRFIGRACLIIGVMKGVDMVEDFTMFERRRQFRAARQSHIITILSAGLDPGYDFQQLNEDREDQESILEKSSPRLSTATLTTHVQSPPAASIRQPLRPNLSIDTSELWSPRSGQRVVVNYTYGSAPSLDFRRSSGLFTFLQGTKSEHEVRHVSPTKATALLNPHSPQSSYLLPGSYTAERKGSETSVFTNARSFTSDSLEVVHALAVQFPSIPPPWQHGKRAGIYNAANIYNVYPFSPNSNVLPDTGLARRTSSVKRKPVPKLDVEPTTPGPPARPRSAPVSRAPRPSSPPPHPPHVSFTPRTSPARRSERRSRTRSVGTRSSVGRSSRTWSTKSSMSSGMELPWALPERDVVAAGKRELDVAWKQLGRESIKSVGSAPRRRTPTPSYTTSNRDSIIPEWHEGSDFREETDALHLMSSSAASIMSDSPTLGL